MESRIHGDMYVRFGGRYGETYCRKAKRHSVPSLPYLLTSGNEIDSGETIDGIKDGDMDRSIQWKCQYEDALIQPKRPVLDINTGEYAAGNRE